MMSRLSQRPQISLLCFQDISLRSGRTNWAIWPRIALCISTALKLDFTLCVIHGISLLRGEYPTSRECFSVLVFDLLRIAFSHEHIIAAIRLRARERIAVLVVLKAPSDCIIGACV